jgi:hypothetical protein
MIFTTQFKREIGLKLLRVVEEFTFGTRVMKELLIACTLTSPLKN